MFLVLLVLAVLVISVFEEARSEWCAEGEMVEDYCSSSGEDRRRRTRTRFDCGSMRIAMELFSLFFLSFSLFVYRFSHTFFQEGKAWRHGIEGITRTSQQRCAAQHRNNYSTAHTQQLRSFGVSGKESFIFRGVLNLY